MPKLPLGRWKTICLTDSYQRESRPRRGTEGIAFVANVPQPLRSDQLYNALLTALEVDEGRASAGKAGRNPFRERQQFAEIFGFDPSQARDSISASIPISQGIVGFVISKLQKSNLEITR